MEKRSSKIPFDKASYYFMGMIALVLLGFWPSYFSKFFNGTNHFIFYFHFHAFMMSLWLSMLIIQPLLIRKKKLAWHRLIGKLSYIIMPLVFIAVILLAHSRHPPDQKNLDLRLFLSFKDLIIMGAMYIIAITYRRHVHIHARAMVATGIVFIEPALNRLIHHLYPAGITDYLITIGVIYTILVILIIKERKQKRGRWVFPLMLGMYIIAHTILIFQIHLGVWQSFSKWFAALPIT